jgi:hypothetical protein
MMVLARIPGGTPPMRDYMAARWRDGTGECGRIEGWPTRPWA